MNGEQYISELARRLRRLPKDEREAAVRWYREYFDEAGEEAALKTLGSPKEAAAKIASELALDASGEKRKPGLAALLALAFPVAAPVGAALLAVALALLLAVLAILLALLASGAACVLAGGTSVVCAAGLLASSLTNACFYFGCGMAMMGVGGVLAMAAIAAWKWLVNFARRVVASRMRKGTKEHEK